MNWVPAGLWIGVAVFAVVILGFCAFELAWKARRLKEDLAALDAVGHRARQLQADLAAVQERLGRISS